MLTSYGEGCTMKEQSEIGLFLPFHFAAPISIIADYPTNLYIVSKQAL